MATVPVYSIDPATGQTVVTYPDGTVVPVLGGQTLGGVDSGTSGTPAPAQTAEDPGYANGYGGRPSSYQRDYSARPPALGSPYPTDLPAYADGSYPGQPRSAGGPAAQFSGDDGGNSWWNLPFTPSHLGGSVGGYHGNADNYGGGSGPGDGGGGGGSALYNAWRSKLIGAAYPGGGSSSYGGASSSYGAYPEPKEPKMRGQYAQGLDPNQALGLAYRPTAMIPRVMPELSGATPLYEQLSGLPAYQLGILSKRGYKGTPSSTANAVGSFYDKVGNDDWMPDTDTLMKNLTSPKKGGGIDDLFGGVKANGSGYEYGKEPLGMGEAAYTYQGLLDAVLQSTLPQETAAKYSAYGNFLIDKGSAKSLKKPAGKGKSINQYVGRKLFKG